MIDGRIRNGGTGEVILPMVTRTETYFERARGLLGRRSLAEGEGLLIAPCNSIHTFFMHIAIDVVFLNSDNTIVAMKKNMPPFRLALSFAASSVLELMAGQIPLAGLKRGDQLYWEAVT